MHTAVYIISTPLILNLARFPPCFPTESLKGRNEAGQPHKW